MYNNKISFFSSGLNQNFFSSLLKNSTTNLIWIHSHPFNRELFKGSLSPEIFAEYLQNDFIYLKHFSISLKCLADRSAETHPKLAQYLNIQANEIVQSEQSMQKQYHKELKYNDTFQPGEAISSYMKYQELSVKNDPIPVALCKILPCFWIYYQLGVVLINRETLDNNPYKEWIDAYTSPSFVDATLYLAETVGQFGDQGSLELRFSMNESFYQAVQFELEFFDEVWSKANLEKASEYAI